VVKVHKLYLDSGIILAFYYKKDSQNKHNRVKKFFKEVFQLKDQINLVCSDFSITEFVQAYVTKPKVSEKHAFEISSDIAQLQKIGRKYPFEWVEVEGKEGKDYEFGAFFIDLRRIILSTKPRPGLGDAIHAVIIKNNKLKYIITFNKKDFKNIKGIIPLEPEEISELLKR